MKKTKKWLSKLNKDTYIKSFLIFWFFFFWSWTIVTDNLNLAGSKFQGTVLAIVITLINVALSVFIFWVAYKLMRKLFSSINPIYATVLALPLFALVDFLIAWLVAFFWLGPQGQIDSVLPLTSPALVISNTPLGLASRFVGFYGLAAFFWLSFFLLIEGKYRRYTVIPIAILASLSVLSWNMYKDTNGSQIRATVISETLDSRVNSISTKNTDLVIFPEYGLDKIDNENLDNRLLKADNKAFFLGSEQVIPPTNQGHYNRLMYGNNQEGITYKQDKFRMIPGGEDMPYSLRFVLTFLRQRSTLQYFGFSKATLKGDHQLKNFVIDENTNLGVAVCSSIIAPQDYREFTRNGASLLTNSASLTTFRGSRLFAWQQKTMARFMAVSNSRYFLQSANASRAYVLDNNGHTISETKGHNTLTLKVNNNHQKTFYTIVGEWLVGLGLIIFLIFLIKYLFKKFRKNK